MNKTALSKSLSEDQQDWLLNFGIERWQTLHPAMSFWRGNSERFEKLAADNYSDRKTANPDPNITDAVKSIFEKQNNTLGILSGTVDFVFAQARDGMFGTRPWFGATPQGMSDTELAEKITKHSQWKFDQSNLEETLIDALKLACDLGTSFVKPSWIKDVETYEENKDVVHLKGEPLLDEAGEYITTEERLFELYPHLKPLAPGEDPAGAVADPLAPDGDVDPLAPVVEPVELIDGADITWVEMNIEQTQEVYNNVSASCVDYKDIAFDMTAPEMDLMRTDVFHRFRMGLLDVISFYGLGEAEAESLRSCVAMGPETEPRWFRGESDTNRSYSEGDANPQMTLIEGFVRCDPFQKGNPKRIQMVFIPELAIMLSCDYLANVTPGGMLPIFPVRCFKTPRRILGRGYWERYEDGDTAIDTLFNSTTYCDRMARFPIKGVDPSKLIGFQAKDINSDPDKVWELQPDQKLADAIQFQQIPDSASRSDVLLQELIQTHQSRTGVTSASQGEMKGLPQSNTATGVNQIISRGATLINWPLMQMRTDLQKAVEFSVHLNYANLDADEVFVFGEGQDAELMSIAPGDVQGLRANVSMNLMQNQNMDKLQDAQVALQTLSQYVALPEIEKEAARKLVVQIFNSLGFTDSDRLVRAPIADAAGLLAIAPPELQGPLQAAMASAGLIMPEPGQEAAGGAPQPNSMPVG